MAGPNICLGISVNEQVTTLNGKLTVSIIVLFPLIPKIKKLGFSYIEIQEEKILNAGSAI